MTNAGLVWISTQRLAITPPDALLWHAIGRRWGRTRCGIPAGVAVRLDAIIAAARADERTRLSGGWRLRDAVRRRDVDEALRALDAMEQGR